MTLKGQALQGARPISFLITIAIGMALWISPAPDGLGIQAWHLFAIFFSTIIGIIFKVLPMGAVSILGITVVAITGVLDTTSSQTAITLAFSGFNNPILWLIVLAFFIARGFIKTGLGRRIAYLFIKVLGRKTLGLSYGLLGADLVLAPAVPSNTARGGGIIYPILRSLAESYGSMPDGKSERKIGSFLILSAFQGNIITSAMFMTAMSANPLAVKIAGDMGIHISWSMWSLAALVPGCIALVIIPLFIYYIYPPEIKETLHASKLATDELTKMGRVTLAEWIMLGTFTLLLVLWIFGDYLNLNSTAGAMVGLAMLLISGVLTWDDIKVEKDAWDTLIWFSTLVMMATFLEQMGFGLWFSDAVKVTIGTLPWTLAFPLLLVIYVYVHYFFASSTAQVMAMYAAFLVLGIALGVPGALMALSLGFASNIYGCMTHYGTGPAPVFFGSGYVDIKSWWSIGFYISIIHLVVWFGIGSLWWKVLGIY